MAIVEEGSQNLIKTEGIKNNNNNLNIFVKQYTLSPFPILQIHASAAGISQRTEKPI